MSSNITQVSTTAVLRHIEDQAQGHYDQAAYAVDAPLPDLAGFSDWAANEGGAVGGVAECIERYDAFRLFGDVEDVLASDWRGIVPTRREGADLHDARSHIADAKVALNRAAR